ncbi:MAG: hypothetical protein OHK0017_04980 [Patescibacteria group bacterium]
MLTPSHAIINLAILGKEKHPSRNLWIVIGSIAPDLPMYFFAALVYFNYGIKGFQVWDSLYYRPFWQIIFNSTHSFVVWPAVWILLKIILNFPDFLRSLQHALKEPRLQSWSWLIKFSAWEYLLFGALGHVFADFWVHASDAYASFYPISEYRFYSPISYYDPKYYGNIVGLIEIILVVVLSFRVFRILQKRQSKIVLVVTVIGLIALYLLKTMLIFT